MATETRSTRTFLVAALVCLAVVGVVVALATRKHTAMVPSAPAAPIVAASSQAAPAADAGVSLPKLWHAPEFSFVDQHGATITLGSLAGKPFIADFIYTQCTSACPLMTSKMVMLQRRLRGRDLRFVSFSVDPQHDTPEVLAAYATQWNAGESRWALLATTPETLDELSKFHIVVIPTGEPADPILHSDVFVLIDADGFARHVYDSTNDAALSALVADAETLAASHADPGKESPTYASLGCGGCHDHAKLAPPLVNLVGAERMLDDGRHVKIDDEYLRRSILDPAADRVTGYPLAMPSYRAQLADADVDALVKELDARAGDAGAPAANVPVVIDPVCGMKVRAEPDAPHITFEGKDYFFCSEACRTSFVAHPERYR